MTDRFAIKPLHDEPPPFQLPVSDEAALIILAAFIITVISIPKFDLAGALAFAAIPLLLFTAAPVQFAPILKRLVIVSPFIAFMAAGNLFLDRATALTIAGVSITGGAISATVIVLKTLLTLSTLLWFMAIMPFHRFGAALRSLGVPEVFVTQLLLVYRYSFLLSEEAAMMQKARDLRSFDGQGKGPIVTARLIGSLLIRTTARAEQIYMAMNARGFRTALAEQRPSLALKASDLAAVAISGTLFALIRYLF